MKHNSRNYNYIWFWIYEEKLLYLQDIHYTIIIKIVLYSYVHHCFIQNSSIKKDTFTTNGQKCYEVSQNSVIKAILQSTTDQCLLNAST